MKFISRAQKVNFSSELTIKFGNIIQNGIFQHGIFLTYDIIIIIHVIITNVYIYF